MWPRAGLMRRLLLATSLTLVVFSDVVPTSPRGCSCCFSGCGGSLSDAASVCRAHALLHRRDELATEVISTPSCARGTRASLAALRRQMPLQLRGGDGGGGGRDRDMRDREASRGSHPGDFNSPGGTRGRFTMRRSMQPRGPASPPALPAGWEQRKTRDGQVYYENHNDCTTH
jgi:hypothetical protein